MTNHTEWDLIIIGSGILGTFSAFHALQKGYRVALIEKNKHPRQATVRNFGQIVPSGLSDSWLPYGLKSLEIYDALTQIGDFTLSNNGSYYIASDEDESRLLQELHTLNQSRGYDCSLLTAEELLSEQPAILDNYPTSALFFPREFSVDPTQMVSRVIDYLIEAQGLDYFSYHLAVGMDRSTPGFLRVHCSNGHSLLGKKVLLTTGAEFQTLFPEYFPNEALDCSLLHMLITQPQKQTRMIGNILTGLSIRRYESFRECASYAEIAARDQTDPAITAAGIHILFKQALNGQVIIGDSHHYAPIHDQDELDYRQDRAVEDLIIREAQSIAHLDTWSVAHSWTGMYSQTKTGDIFETTIDTDIHILTAIGGKGMTASPGYTFAFINKLFGHDTYGNF